MCPNKTDIYIQSQSAAERGWDCSCVSFDVHVYDAQKRWGSQLRVRATKSGDLLGLYRTAALARFVLLFRYTAVWCCRLAVFRPVFHPRIKFGTLFSTALSVPRYSSAFSLRYVLFSCSFISPLRSSPFFCP